MHCGLVVIHRFWRFSPKCQSTRIWSACQLCVSWQPKDLSTWKLLDPRCCAAGRLLPQPLLCHQPFVVCGFVGTAGLGFLEFVTIQGLFPEASFPRENLKRLVWADPITFDSSPPVAGCLSNWPVSWDRQSSPRARTRSPLHTYQHFATGTIFLLKMETRLQSLTPCD